LGWAEVIGGWRSEYPEVDRWLKRVPSYAERGGEYFNNGVQYAYRFFEWLRNQHGRFHGLGVSEVIRLQADLRGRERYELLDLAQDFVSEFRGVKKSKEKVYMTIRSVFLHNRCELPRDKFIIRGDYEPSPMNMSLPEFKALLREANILYRSVFLTKFQAKMGLKEVVWFSNNSWHEVDPQLRKGSLWLHDMDRIILHMPGRKGGKPYYTSLERDGVKALRLYLKKWRGPVKSREPIYVNANGNPLTVDNVRDMWFICCVKAGIVKPKTPSCDRCGAETFKRRIRRGPEQKTWYICPECGHRRTPTKEDARELARTRYGKGSHEGCRDLVRSRWEKSEVKEWVAEFRMGHNVDPNNYQKIMKNDPAWAEEQFEVASPWLNIVSEDPEHVHVRELRARARDEVMVVEQRMEERYGKLLETMQREIKALKRRINLEY